MFKQLLTFILLFINWIIFSGKFDLFHIAIGLIAALIVSLLSGHFVFDSPNRKVKDYLRTAIKMPFYIVWLFWNILKSNFYVIYLAFHPNMKKIISPRLLQIKTNDLKDEFSRYVFAQSVTLTPGTVTVLAESDVFTIHAISDYAAESLPNPLESKVKNTFEPIAINNLEENV